MLSDDATEEFDTCEILKIVLKTNKKEKKKNQQITRELRKVGINGTATQGVC